MLPLLDLLLLLVQDAALEALVLLNSDHSIILLNLLADALVIGGG